MHDDSCDVILYADDKEYIRFRNLCHAEMFGIMTAHEVRESFSKSMQHYFDNFEHEEVSEHIKPPQQNQMDNLEIRMRIEKIPFFEAIRLMGLKRAIRYQFHGKLKGD